MQGIFEERLLRRPLDDLSAVHHPDRVGDVTNDAEIVRDEEHAQTPFKLQGFEKVQHLRLDRHVERARRLVADQKVGARGDRPRDRNPLSLSARELVGIFFERLFGEAHEACEFAKLRPSLGRAHFRTQTFQGLLPNGRHRHAGVEARVGVLKDPVDVTRTEHLHVLSVHRHLSPVGGEHPRGDSCEGGLAAARLADECDGFAPADREGYAVDGDRHVVPCAGEPFDEPRTAKREDFAHVFHPKNLGRRPERFEATGFERLPTPLQGRVKPHDRIGNASAVVGRKPAGGGRAAAVRELGALRFTTLLRRAAARVKGTPRRPLRRIGHDSVDLLEPE